VSDEIDPNWPPPKPKHKRTDTEPRTPGAPSTPQGRATKVAGAAAEPAADPSPRRFSMPEQTPTFTPSRSTALSGRVGVLERFSPSRQSFISAALLIPTLVIYLVFLEGVRPAIEDPYSVGTAYGLWTLVYSAYFVAVIGFVARNGACRKQALLIASAIAVLDTGYSWYTSSPDALATRNFDHLVFTAIMIGYVAAWGVARRQHRAWQSGLAATIVVAAINEFGISIRGGWFIGWLTWPGVFVLCCLLCWAAEAFGKRSAS
jgi:hypothetical protein